MKISTRRDALFAQLQTVTRAASTRPLGGTGDVVASSQAEQEGVAHRDIGSGESVAGE